MTALDIVRAAIPGADVRLAEAILWERTSFPCGSVTARDLYRAAARFHRAAAKGIWLCDWCDRAVSAARGLCPSCTRLLRVAALQRESHDTKNDETLPGT